MVRRKTAATGSIRVREEELAAIDALAEELGFTRSETIRRLIEVALPIVQGELERAKSPAERIFVFKSLKERLRQGGDSEE